MGDKPGDRPQPLPPVEDAEGGPQEPLVPTERPSSGDGGVIENPPPGDGVEVDHRSRPDYGNLLTVINLPFGKQIKITRRRVLAVIGTIMGGVAANAIYDIANEPDLSRIEIIEETAYGKDGTERKRFQMEFTPEAKDLAEKVFEARQEVEHKKAEMEEEAEEVVEEIESLLQTLDTFELPDQQFRSIRANLRRGRDYIKPLGTGGNTLRDMMKTDKEREAYDLAEKFRYEYERINKKAHVLDLRGLHRDLGPVRIGAGAKDLYPLEVSSNMDTGDFIDNHQFLIYKYNTAFDKNLSIVVAVELGINLTDSRRRISEARGVLEQLKESRYVENPTRENPGMTNAFAKLHPETPSTPEEELMQRLIEIELNFRRYRAKQSNYVHAVERELAMRLAELEAEAREIK